LVFHDQAASAHRANKTKEALNAVFVIVSGANLLGSANRTDLNPIEQMRGMGKGSSNCRGTLRIGASGFGCICDGFPQSDDRELFRPCASHGLRNDCSTVHRSTIRICILACGLQNRLLMHEKPRQNLSGEPLREAESYPPLCPGEICLGYWQADRLVAFRDRYAVS
jgi:hypothetical protein